MSLTRRSFLARLAGVAALVPLVRASKPEPTPMETYTAGLARGDYDHLCVQGIAIKVPSNRVFVPSLRDYPNGYHAYPPPWDGTFKLERGCTNPAYILADLYERTGDEPDWVVERQMPVPTTLVMTGLKHLLTVEARLNWPMLYDWGRFCDELTDTSIVHCEGDLRQIGASRWGPRFEVNTVCQTPADMVALRETLRMHCLHWQGSDPRWRTSYPVYS